MRLLTLAIAVALCLSMACSPAHAEHRERPWLAVSDIHFGPDIGDDVPSPDGEDTNSALLTSLLAELHREDPDPPVVLIAGDFLAHQPWKANAAPTIVEIAHRFDAVFPHAQFLITLGNNDSNCGDYAAPRDGPFLAAVARGWEPLVNRNGAAPGFLKSFAHDGSYVTRLPVPGLRAVVINDVSLALRFGASCASGIDVASEALDDLASGLRHAPGRSRTWVLLHVPPGIDAFSTSHLTHHLAVVPFLRPHARETLESDIENSSAHVALIVAGHTHKFGYRIVPGPHPVPILGIPSVSPIFYNSPSFLTLRVDGMGTVETVDEFSFLDGAWQHLGDVASLGVHRFDVPNLLALQARLAKDPQLRKQFSRLYSGGGPSEIDESNWQTYWCAATALSATAFQECERVHGFSVFTPRALELGGVVAVAVLACFVASIFFVRGRSGGRRGRTSRAR